MRTIKLFYCKHCQENTPHRLEGIQNWAIIPGKADQEVWTCEQCESTFYKDADLLDNS